MRTSSVSSALLLAASLSLTAVADSKCGAAGKCGAAAVKGEATKCVAQTCKKAEKGEAMKCAGGVCKATTGALKADASAPAYGTIDTKALQALVKAKAAMVVLDARGPKYDDGKRLPGAKVLTPQASEADAAALIPNKESLVVTYCGNVKCPASQRLAEVLAGYGYKNVIKYPAGVEGWVADGNDVEALPKQ